MLHFHNFLFHESCCFLMILHFELLLKLVPYLLIQEICRKKFNHLSVLWSSFLLQAVLCRFVDQLEKEKIKILVFIL